MLLLTASASTVGISDLSVIKKLYAFLSGVKVSSFFPLMLTEAGVRSGITFIGKLSDPEVSL